MKRLFGRLYLVLVLVVAYYFTTLFFSLAFEFRGAPWPELTDGTAKTPFQYRVLVPWVVSAVARLFPDGERLAACRHLYFWATCATVFALVLSLKRYLVNFLGDRLARIFAFSIFLILPYNFLLNRFLALRYPTDIPSILFFTLGLVLIYSKRWRLYYPLFILATLNRETSCFLAVAYFCTSVGREKRKVLLGHLAAQVTLWVGVKYGLYLAYGGNPGDGMCVFNAVHNLDFLKDPKAYPLFLSNLGFLWIPVLVYWRIIPDQFVKRTVWLIPTFFLGMFLVGNMYELRIYGELLPVVVSASCLILRELFSREKSPGGTV